MADVNINNEHKSRIFEMLFGREEHKEWTLSLYNSVNGTAYEDPSALVFNTIDDALYMKMKNDVSFLITDTMNLYEHQSSPNPNMPLRQFIYAAMAYSRYVEDEKNRINLYSSVQQTIPVPKLVCFYNGLKEEPDRSILNLRDAFDHPEKSDIDVRVTMLNINYGRNKELMEKCRALREYSWFIHEIRENKKAMGNMRKAVGAAIDSMPDDFMIKALILANRAEVEMSCITEYDEAYTMGLFMEEGRTKGFKEGQEQERANTDRERKRADEAEVRAGEAEKQNALLEEKVTDLQSKYEAAMQQLAAYTAGKT